MRKFVRKANAEQNPFDEVSKIPTDPRYLVKYDGREVDGRPRSLTLDPYPYDEPIERYPSPPNESDA